MCVLHLQSLPRTFVYALSSRPLPYRVTYRRPAQRVEAKYQRGTKYYPGRVVVVNGDGTLLNIQYADGDQEIEVPRALVQPLEGYAGEGGGGGGGGRGGGGRGGGEGKEDPAERRGESSRILLLAFSPT